MGQSGFQIKRREFILANLAMLLGGCIDGEGGGAGTSKETYVSTTSFSLSPTAPTVGALVYFADTGSAGSGLSWLWEFGDGSTSNLQFTGHIYLAAGAYTVKLSVTTAAGVSVFTRQLVVTAAAAGGPAFNMQQTLSDGAQRTTLAFSGLAMMTGNLAAQSFFPPGKVADYTGFQYLRDNDPDNMGHNTSFLTRIANNVIYILNSSQLAQLQALAVAQGSQIDSYGYQRFTLMQAFRQIMDGTRPRSSLSLAKVKAFSGELYRLDGQISYDRAVLYASIFNSLDTQQKAYLDAMKGRGWLSWPNVTDAQVQSKTAGLPAGTKVAVMTYASDLFSWYASPLEADIYFCPERQGTYYGGFYIKDAPAIGHEGYGINEQLTATAGMALSDSREGYVTAAQAEQMSSLVALQRANLYAGASNIVQCRIDIALRLRLLRFASSNSDVIKAQVLALSARYGELDGENNYNYANVFCQVYESLSAAQKSRLADLRHSILSGKYADGSSFDFSTATTPYLYANPVTNQAALTPYLSAAAGLFQS